MTSPTTEEANRIADKLEAILSPDVEVDIAARMLRDLAQDRDAWYKAAKAREEQVARQDKRSASLEAFLAKLPCPESGSFEVEDATGRPCKSCDESWTEEKATRYYHGTALAAWKKEQETKQ